MNKPDNASWKGCGVKGSSITLAGDAEQNKKT